MRFEVAASLEHRHAQLWPVAVVANSARLPPRLFPTASHVQTFKRFQSSSRPLVYHHGSCHCGDVQLSFGSFRWSELGCRKCAYTFCRKQGARNISDPQGRVVIRTQDGSNIATYRFGLKTADFLWCRKCATYFVAMMRDPASSALFATLNINSLNPPLPQFKGSESGLAAQSVSYDNENDASRIARRIKNWTPTAIEYAGSSAKLACVCSRLCAFACAPFCVASCACLHAQAR